MNLCGLLLGLLLPAPCAPIAVFTAVCYDANEYSNHHLYNGKVSECGAIGQTSASIHSDDEWARAKAAIAASATTSTMTVTAGSWEGANSNGYWGWIDGSNFDYCPIDSTVSQLPVCGSGSTNYPSDHHLCITTDDELAQCKEGNAFNKCSSNNHVESS